MRVCGYVTVLCVQAHNIWRLEMIVTLELRHVDIPHVLCRVTLTVHVRDRTMLICVAHQLLQVWGLTHNLAGTCGIVMYMGVSQLAPLFESWS